MRILLLFCALLLAGGAAAQTRDVNQKAANRRALRDARKYPAPYKDSHLYVDKDAFKREGGGRKAQAEAAEEQANGQENYKFDNTGTARVSEPSQPLLRLRRKKKEQAGSN